MFRTSYIHHQEDCIVHTALCDVCHAEITMKAGRPWRFQEVEAPRFQDTRHMKVVRLSALCTGRLYTPHPRRKYFWYSFLLGVEWTPGPTGPKWLCQWKTPVTPSEIKPATFWLLAQCFNQMRHRVPHYNKRLNNISEYKMFSSSNIFKEVCILKVYISNLNSYKRSNKM
jgi:hypothetical protein